MPDIYDFTEDEDVIAYLNKRGSTLAHISQTIRNNENPHPELEFVFDNVNEAEAELFVEDSDPDELLQIDRPSRQASSKANFQSAVHVHKRRKQRQEKRISSSSDSEEGGEDQRSRFLKGVNQEYGDEILATLVTTTGSRLEEIFGNEAAKAALEQCVILPALNPKLFSGIRSPSKGILLFGPPGNGKTLLAKTVAAQCSSAFFNISAATIVSKWLGDGEKLVKALFQVAKNAQPSIIFIDEIDSMLCRRSEREDQAERRLKTEFLVQLDGCTSHAEDHVVVLGATNRPWELDEGILRRFQQRILVDLPNAEARARMIWQTFAKDECQTLLSDENWKDLAAKTEGYSYSDLNGLCRTAALIPLESLDRSRVREINPAELRALTIGDLEAALLRARPSTVEENRQKLMRFAQKYAQIP